MQNNQNCGCGGQMGSCQGFVPTSGNWDFNMNDNCGCQQSVTRRNRRNPCDECEQNCSRTRDAVFENCLCERGEVGREAACCEQNTELRQKKNACTRMADCPCEACTANRARRCPCTVEETQCSGHARKNKTVGMINVEMQEIDEIFESESALRAGTLFPELHKPMNGYCPYDENCATCQQAAAFAAWEMRLYLNTHPHDKEALALFRKLCKEAGKENYATAFLPDDCCTEASRAPVWNWVKNPWPWEFDCDCGDRRLGGK